MQKFIRGVPAKQQIPIIAEICSRYPEGVTTGRYAEDQGVSKSRAYTVLLGLWCRGFLDRPFAQKVNTVYKPTKLYTADELWSIYLLEEKKQMTRSASAPVRFVRTAKNVQAFFDGFRLAAKTPQVVDVLSDIMLDPSKIDGLRFGKSEYSRAREQSPDTPASFSQGFAAAKLMESNE